MTDRASIEAEYAAAIEAHNKALAAVAEVATDFRQGRFPADKFIELRNAEKAALARFDAAFSAMADLPEEAAEAKATELNQLSLI